MEKPTSEEMAELRNIVNEVAPLLTVSPRDALAGMIIVGVASRFDGAADKSAELADFAFKCADAWLLRRFVTTEAPAAKPT